MEDISTSKPSTDLKEYRLVQLKSGLEVLLVSTKALIDSKGIEFSRATASAACLVQVGSFADPPKLAEGIAHFLEHMVFMGSEKYPGENEYDAFVSSHGGGCNAFTEAEHTVYQFDVNAEHFPKALDIFANCFICPLLSMSSSSREIKAIESEFNLALNSDGSRVDQINYGAASGGHVLGKFSWGNKKSLVSKPKELKVDMQAILKGFHATHYFPQNAKVVAVAPKTLDEIQRDVEASFNAWQGISTSRTASSGSSSSGTRGIGKGMGVGGGDRRPWTRWFFKKGKSFEIFYPHTGGVIETFCWSLSSRQDGYR